MSTAHDCCRPGSTKRRITRAAGAALLPGLLLTLVPKCPLCLVAYLSALGLGAGAAGLVAGALRPLAWGLLAGLAAAVVWFAARRTRSEGRSG